MTSHGGTYTLSLTTEARRQMARLDTYMKNVAKGDITRLFSHTRGFLYKLNAAGETKQDLINNLIYSLQKAPDANFPRWV